METHPPLAHERDDLAQNVRLMQESPVDKEFDVYASEGILQMHQEIIDDSPQSKAVETLVSIMDEFWDDGEPFQPSQDEELRDFIEEVIRREVPGLSDDDLRDLMARVPDFPPAETREVVEA